MSRIQKKTNQLIPKIGVILYQSSETDNIEYIEKIDFVKKENCYDVKSSRPFSFDEMIHFSGAIAKTSGLYMEGLIPKNVLFYNTSNSVNKVVWFVPAKIRKLFFQDEKLSGEYEIPDMIFVSENSDLYVYLVKAKDVKKLNEDTNLYRTHFYNVYQDCKVCIGNGYKPKQEKISITKMIEKIEINFFSGSIFTHAHVNPTMLSDVWNKNKGIYPESKWNQVKKIKELL